MKLVTGVSLDAIDAEIAAETGIGGSGAHAIQIELRRAQAL